MTMARRLGDFSLASMTSRSTPQATKNVWILFAEEKELSGAQKRRVDIVPGHKQAHRHHGALSALPPKAVIGNLARNVRFVPKADIRIATTFSYSITSSARARTVSGTVRPRA